MDATGPGSEPRVKASGYGTRGKCVGSKKREAFFRGTVKAAGGTTEAAYWAYGDDDVFVIVDLPDAATATGLSLAFALTGSFHVATTPLLTAADMEAGAKKRPSYRAPGA